jgi:uroporphyrinogen-III synthase
MGMIDLKLPVYLLTEEKHNGILNYPVIKINYLISEIDFRGVDYLLFTSKNGVRAVDNLTDEWKKYPSFAIGEATAKEIKSRGGKVEYVAKKAYGDEFAKEINEKYTQKTFLFLRAKKIVSNIKDYFKNNTLKEVVVYETLCNKPKEVLKKPAIAIFSSPSTVECFSKVNDFENVLPIAIGKKTKNALLEFVKENQIIMPKKPSIKECIRIAKEIKFR